MTHGKPNIFGGESVHYDYAPSPDFSVYDVLAEIRDILAKEPLIVTRIPAIQVTIGDSAGLGTDRSLRVALSVENGHDDSSKLVYKVVAPVKPA